MPKITKKTVEVFVVEGKDFVSSDEAKKYFIRCLVQQWADKVGLCRGGEWSQDMVVNEILESFPFAEYLEAQKADKQTGRFFLFAWDRDEPAGGFQDLLDSYDTKDAAVKFAEDLAQFYNWQVIDSHTGEVIRSSWDEKKKKSK